jgi:thiamine-phosphate pyrophosphorylase
MRSLPVLAALARRLNRDMGAPAAPSLYFFTDPERTPDPAAVARRLPRGSAVVFRHFGRADRFAVGAELAAICRSRGLFLLISADPTLARTLKAGVHWPARLARRRGIGKALVTMSAHTRLDVARAQRFGADVCVLGAVFPTRSSAQRRPLGLARAAAIARAARVPVIALGGVNTRTARQLIGRGFAGLAAVDAFLDV